MQRERERVRAIERGFTFSVFTGPNLGSSYSWRRRRVGRRRFRLFIIPSIHRWAPKYNGKTILTLYIMIHYIYIYCYDVAKFHMAHNFCVVVYSSMGCQINRNWMPIILKHYMITRMNEIVINFAHVFFCNVCHSRRLLYRAL